MTYTIAWWNVENLFDTVSSTARPAWLQTRLAKELKGWTTTVLNQKIRQLSHVIRAMNNDQGPDILGVCEVENRPVLEKLVASLRLAHRDYGIVHADTGDKRGIDIAFIYDRSLFTVDPDAIFNQVILKRNATRDILQATFRTRAHGHEFILMGHHWPSRLGGKAASAPYRMMAGEMMAYWHQRIIALKGEIPVFALGDFNDEPFDASLQDYGLSTRALGKVTSRRARKPYFYNLMWNRLDDAIATHVFDGVWGMLDQALVNRAGLARTGIYCTPNAVEIFETDAMINRGKPVRFSRPSNKNAFNPDGYSDHLPLLLTVKEKS
ncbi:MAG: endonuclease/exonuclease/phosphatase family protein [Pseudomonadota bacterium]